MTTENKCEFCERNAMSEESRFCYNCAIAFREGMKTSEEQTNQNIIKLREELKEFSCEGYYDSLNDSNIDELFQKHFPQIGNHNSLSDTEESNSLDNVPSKDKIMNNSEQDVISNCKYFNRSVSEVNNQGCNCLLQGGWRCGNGNAIFCFDCQSKQEKKQ